MEHAPNLAPILRPRRQCGGARLSPGKAIRRGLSNEKRKLTVSAWVTLAIHCTTTRKRALTAPSIELIRESPCSPITVNHGRNMELPEAVEYLRKNKRSFYHFTDVRNLESIRRLGLLATAHLRAQEIVPVYGGNDISLEADRAFGVDHYVHLSFSPDHPLLYLAKKDQRIEQPRIIRVAPEVLLLEGVKICDGVSNKAGMVLGEPMQTLRGLDLVVLYFSCDWNDPEIKARRKVAKLYEVLVPSCVPIEYLSNIDG